MSLILYLLVMLLITIARSEEGLRHLCPPHVDLSKQGICASNGVTFKTFYEYESAKELNPRLAVVHYGPCTPDDFGHTYTYHAKNYPYANAQPNQAYKPFVINNPVQTKPYHGKSRCQSFTQVGLKCPYPDTEYSDEWMYPNTAFVPQKYFGVNQENPNTPKPNKFVPSLDINSSFDDEEDSEEIYTEKPSKNNYLWSYQRPHEINIQSYRDQEDPYN